MNYINFLVQIKYAYYLFDVMFQGQYYYCILNGSLGLVFFYFTIIIASYLIYIYLQCQTGQKRISSGPVSPSSSLSKMIIKVSSHPSLFALFDSSVFHRSQLIFIFFTYICLSFTVEKSMNLTEVASIIVNPVCIYLNTSFNFLVVYIFV